MTFAAFFAEPTKSWLVCFLSKKSFRLKDPQRKVERSRYISVKDPQGLYLRPEKFSFEVSPVYLLTSGDCSSVAVVPQESLPVQLSI